MDLAALLLDWLKNARALPWREDYDPYKVLVSEFMLQQTQVSTVLPYFERWGGTLSRLVVACACRRGGCLKSSGKGLHYSRLPQLVEGSARDDRRRATPRLRPPPRRFLPIRASDPTRPAPWRASRTTSSARRGRQWERVFARVYDIAEQAGGSALKKISAEKVSILMPRDRARLQSGFDELGALVCLPKKTGLRGLPLNECCLARARGTYLGRPCQSARPAAVIISAWGALCLLGRQVSFAAAT